MSDRALMVLLLAALIAGPAGAFLVSPWILAAYLVFPLAGFLSMGRAWLLRAAALELPAAASLLLGLAMADEVLAQRALRWTAAVPCGLIMASWMGTARMERLVMAAARRLEWVREPLELVALLLASAGPSATSVRREFAAGRGSGMGFARAAEAALGRVVLVSPGRGRPGPLHGLAPVTAVLAWALFLAGVGGF